MKQWRKRIAAAIAAAAVLLMVNGGTGMEFQAAAYQDTKEYQSLSAAFQEYFSVGVAVQAIDHWNDPTAEIGNPAKEELIVSSFNSMTFGNEFKPAYNFDPKSPTLFSVDPAAEELLDFAKENHIPVRGHTLVWHSQVNPAIFARDFQPTCRGRLTRDEKAELDEECLVDRETLIERLRTYIYGLLEYTYKNGYADVIYAWDVVNEASDEEQPDGFRRSYWYRIIGPEFLYYSFLFAREASVKYSGEYASLYGLDPEKDDLSSIRPLLFYNDYNEWFERRSDAIIRFLTEDVYNPGQSMVESAILTGDTDGTIYGDGLLDGIGMQGHLDDTQNIGQYMKALEKYDEAVGLVHITELDVGKTQKGEKGEAHQAQFYYDFFSRLMEEKEKGVNLACVTFWGLTDDASWRKGADPLLFYEDLGRKPAFEAVLAAARKDAFTLQGAPAQGDSVYSERIDFEPYKENGTTVTVPPNSVGFYSRGSGHQSVLVLVNKENHTEGAPIGFCLRVQREEKDATVKKEMNAFLGAQVEITMHVKTEDSAIILGLEGGEQTELLRTASDGDWTELHTECHIPADWPSAALYLETDGTADIY
ncbi:MAG: endo-1,4-beta-xylanase, partial [Blautia sp.]|nr:endo-1,4-beta-xylanase [Blautia sp.]